MFKLRILGIMMLASLFFLSGCGGDDKAPTKKPVQSTQQAPAVQSNQQATKPYEVVYSIKTKRFDKGINLYVLVEANDYSKDPMKEDIKGIINKLVKENGAKTSIDFFDDKRALEVHYQKWVTQKLNPTQADNNLLSQHYIAGFSGDLSTGIYRNSLTYFPTKNASTIEYNPK